MEQHDLVKHILRHTNHGSFVNSSGGTAWAPSNVALVKYWGKRNAELNLPVTSSLSVSLGSKGAFTHIKQEGVIDGYIVNGVMIAEASAFALRLKKFLDLFRPQNAHYLIEVDTNLPIAAGFASSACGFASLVQALNQLYDWRLNKVELSILARLGSGSACRSLFEGFIEWQRGERDDGIDSYGIKLESIWPELRIGMLTVSTEEKRISSREAMQHTLLTSPIYADWPGQVAQDLLELKLALARKDFILLGKVAENNAIAMHKMMAAANPPVIYSLPETLLMINKIQTIRLSRVPLFFTQDAGPNLQLLFLAEDEATVLKVFPELEVVLPFIDSGSEKVALVDHNDVEIGVSEKLAAHIQGKLHRAFSIVILRKNGGRLEMLLQQRSSSKYHSANLWSNSCCGHPRPGEEIIAAATRRLREELGFGVDLKEMGKFHYRAKIANVGLIENELDHLLVGFSDLTEELPFNLDEVQDYCWMELGELQRELQNYPDKYTVWLPLLLQFLFKHV